MECVKCNRELPEGALWCCWCGKKQVSESRKHRKRANGTGTVYKLSGSRSKPYAAEIKGIMLGTYKTRADAQKALDRLVDQDVTDKFNMTFEEVYEAWSPAHFRKISQSHVQDYKGAYKHCESLYNRKFRSLRKSDFTAVIMDMEDLGYSESTIGKLRQLFGAMSQWAIEETIITVSHATHLETIAKQKSTRKVFTPDELKRIQACGLKQAAILRILIATGCRPADLFTARVENCHNDYFISGSKTDAGRDRAIGVSEYGLADYQTLLMMATMTAGAENLIDGYQGNRDYKNWYKREWSDLQGACKLEGKTPYCARHTYTTMAARSGVPQDVLRRQLGHSNIHTTDSTYKHLDESDIINASKMVKL